MRRLPFAGSLQRPMRFGIRMLVFVFAVAPFTWVSIMKAIEASEAGTLDVGDGLLAGVMALMSLGYIYSIIESIYHRYLDAKDARDEERENQASERSPR